MHTAPFELRVLQEDAFLSHLPNPRVLTARHRVVIDQSNRLDHRVNDRTAHERKTTLFEVSAHPVGKLGSNWRMHPDASLVLDGSAIDPIPKVLPERPKLLLNFQKRAGILDGGVHLCAVSNNARIGEQPINIRLSVRRHSNRVEPFEGRPIAFAPLQNGKPTESGLRTVQNEIFKKPTLAALGHTPFGIVIGDF